MFFFLVKNIAKDLGSQIPSPLQKEWFFRFWIQRWKDSVVVLFGLLLVVVVVFGKRKEAKKKTLKSHTHTPKRMKKKQHGIFFAHHQSFDWVLWSQLKNVEKSFKWKNIHFNAYDNHMFCHSGMFECMKRSTKYNQLWQ